MQNLRRINRTIGSDLASGIVNDSTCFYLQDEVKQAGDLIDLQAEEQEQQALQEAGSIQDNDVQTTQLP